MAKLIYTVLSVLFLWGMLPLAASAQCTIENNFFKAGEYVTYDLYIKLGATIKGGYASLSTQAVKYAGQEAYRMSLISASQGLARKMFPLNDTLTCYMSKQLTPLAYTKNAHEGDDETFEKLAYSYSGNNVKIRTIRHKNGTFRFDETLSFSGCTYDLMSILFYARTLRYDLMASGSSTKVNFVTGKSKVSMRIVYNGKEKVKANDGKSYNCIRLTLYVLDEAFDNGKESMKVFITDDSNRLPVKVESKLKVGSTRVVLRSYRGNLHPLNEAN
jgi:hypothetical protein